MTAGSGGSVRVWDLHSRPRPDVLFRHGAAVRDIAFGPNGQLATASADRTARVWDARTGAPLTRPLRHEHAVTCVAFDADGGRLVTGAGVNAQIWDARTGKPLGPPLTHEAAVRRVSFSRDGRLLLVAAAGSRQRPAQTLVWEAKTRRQLVVLRHCNHVLLPALSPDGRRLATPAEQARDTVEIRDAETGRRLLPPLKHRGEVWSVSFSPDGRRLVTACSDTSLTGLYAQVWDAGTGQPVGAR